MKTPFTKSKKGFTIIEVSLVLAIGGLIMLMVFIAWPAVQRNQRDSQRKNSDLDRLFTSIVNFSNNNSGRLPGVPGGASNPTSYFVQGNEDGDATGTSTADWIKLYNNYLLAQGDHFVDPVGTAYNLFVITCSDKGTNTAPNSGLDPNNEAKKYCDKTGTVGEGADQVTLFKNSTIDASFDDQASTITIVVGATCDGEKAMAATKNTGGTRKFAILYKLESGGVFCQSN